MKIENPFNFLGRYSKFEAGESLKIKFKIPQFEDPKYGSITGLEGEIPLFLNHGEFPSSKFYELSELEQMKLVKKYSAYIQAQDENLDDKGLESSALLNILLATTQYPRLDPYSIDFDYCVKSTVVVFIADDVLDFENYYDGFDRSKVIVKLTEAFKEIQNGDLEGYTTIGRILPPLQPTSDLLVKFLNQKEKLIPGYIKSNYWTFSSSLNALLTQILLFTKTVVPDNTGKFALAGCNKGMDIALEVDAAIQGLVVGRNIRETILFKELMDCFYIITAGLNDIRGLIRDITNNETLDNSILSRVNDKKDLKTAYQEVLSTVRERYKMVESYSRFLQQCYSNDKDLQQYLMLFREKLDGQTLAYFGFGNIEKSHRYGVGWDAYVEKGKLD